MEDRQLRVCVETPLHRIVGMLTLPDAGWRSRMTDYLNAADRDFFALTDAEVSPAGDPRAVERHPFVVVSRTHVVIALEAPASGV